MKIILLIITKLISAVLLTHAYDKECGPNAHKPRAVCECLPLFTGTYPFCYGEPYLPVTTLTPITPCEKDMVRVGGECVKPCGPFEIRSLNGTCTKIPCYKGWKGTFVPDCIPPQRIRSCYDEGKIGIYPNCIIPPCQAGYTGPPKNCKPIPVPCPRDWIGNFQPNCTPPTTPIKCPPGYSGSPPNCVVLYCSDGTQVPENGECKVLTTCDSPCIGTKPNCTCPPCIYPCKGIYPNCRCVDTQCPYPCTGIKPNCKCPCKLPCKGFEPNCECPSTKCKAPCEGFESNCECDNCTNNCPKKCLLDNKCIEPKNCDNEKCPAGSIGKRPYCRCPCGHVGYPPEHCFKIDDKC